MSASKAGHPVMVYVNKTGEKQILWHRNHKLGDKIVYLKHLKRMAAYNELAKEITKFEAWQSNPEFPDDQEGQ